MSFEGIASADNSELIESNGFIVHSFDGERVLRVRDTSASNWTDWKVHLSANEEAETSADEYNQNFQLAQDIINSGQIKKVVLSRTKLVDNTRSPVEIFADLNDRYKNTFNYLLIADNECWIGATPELLLHIQDSSVSTVSLAGTKVDGEEWGDKEIHEQQIVTDYIADALAPFCSELKIGETKTVSSGAVQHLKSEIEGTLLSEANKAEISASLHPTPATCGFPLDASRGFILSNEPHRSFYTGYIGIVQNNSLRAYVNLRCMQLFDGKAKLYLGGGITKDSVLEKEWNETERKAQTLLSVLESSK